MSIISQTYDAVYLTCCIQMHGEIPSQVHTAHVLAYFSESSDQRNFLLKIYFLPLNSDSGS